MKVFLAGATGAIGSRLLPLLVRARHNVTGTTRTPTKADSIRATGAQAIVLDALNPDSVMNIIQEARPDVIIHQLTAIPARLNLRKFDRDFAMTNRLRTEGTDNLLAAAKSQRCSPLHCSKLRRMAFRPSRRPGQDGRRPTRHQGSPRTSAWIGGHSSRGVGSCRLGTRRFGAALRWFLWTRNIP